MKNLLRVVMPLCFILMITMSTTVTAQSKIGHINSAELLSAMPAAKSAEKQLENYTKQLDNQYQNMVTSLQGEYQSIQKQVQEGLMTPQQVAEKEKYFLGEQEKVAKFEYDAQQKVGKKREELLGPILQRAEKAIQDVARENGYTYILDTSLGAVLHAAPSDDIMSKVKSKLGM